MELTTSYVDVSGLRVRFRRVSATAAIRLNAAATSASTPEEQLSASLDMLAHTVADVQGVTDGGEPVAFPSSLEARRDFLDMLGLDFLLAASAAVASALSPSEEQRGK